MIDHIRRERLWLADRLMRLGPQGRAFAVACTLERLRAVIAGLKGLRDLARGSAS